MRAHFKDFIFVLLGIKGVVLNISAFA